MNGDYRRIQVRICYRPGYHRDPARAHGPVLHQCVEQIRILPPFITVGGTALLLRSLLEHASLVRRVGRGAYVPATVYADEADAFAGSESG